MVWGAYYSPWCEITCVRVAIRNRCARGLAAGVALLISLSARSDCELLSISRPSPQTRLAARGEPNLFLWRPPIRAAVLSRRARSWPPRSLASSSHRLPGRRAQPSRLAPASVALCEARAAVVLRGTCSAAQPSFFSRAPHKIGEIGPRMHAKSFVGLQAHSHGPLCMQALQGSTPLVVTPPSRQTRNLARASRETPSPPIALEVGIELLDTRASLPRLPRPLSLCKKKSLRTREREGGRAHHRICPLKSTFGWLGHRSVL